MRSEDPDPLALKYLQSIGVEAAEAVQLVVVTHWHDDHIGGIAKTIEYCKSAAVCVSSSFTKDEFTSFLAAHADPLASKFGTGVDEITSVFGHMRAGRRSLRGVADKRLLFLDAHEVSHSQPIEIWSISPSDFQVLESLGKIASLIPTFGETKRRAVPTGPNDGSVALWLSIGEDAILLGADLEETADPRGGWSAVLASTERPRGRADYFKVPHHGSETGHNPRVWSDLLHPSPVAVLTPWNRARKLPQQTDIERLESYTNRVELTAPPAELSRVRHDHEVERLLRDFGIRTYREPREVGIVTARKTLGAGTWQITRSAA